MSFNRSKEEKESVFFVHSLPQVFVETYQAPSVDDLKPLIFTLRRNEFDVFLTKQEALAWISGGKVSSFDFRSKTVIFEAVAVAQKSGAGLYAVIDNIEDIVGFSTYTGIMYQNPHFQATKKREEAEARLAAKRLFLIAKWSSHPALDKHTVANGILPFIASPEILFKTKNPQSTGQEKDNKATEQATSTLGKRQSYGNK